MPCSQMISMNISPPRPSEASSVAMLPKLKARIRNSWRRNIASSRRTSITANTASSRTPTAIAATTRGFVQPIVWPPYGWMP